jgi:hypothetical protein
MSLNLGNTTIKDIYLGGTKIKEAYLGSSKVFASAPLVIDLNGKGRELTSEWYSQTKYPGVWTGLRIFSSGTAINGSYSPNGTYITYIRNIGKLSSNFTLRYLPDCRNSTSYGYGRGTYLADNTQLFYNTCPYGSGQDGNQPRYDKSRYYSVSVNVSKGGDIQMYFYTRATWYTNTLYYAIPEELVGKVINSL